MESFFKKNILLAIFLDIFVFLSLYLMFSASQILNYNPQTHINIRNPIYNFAIDLLLLFISQITLIRLINSKLLKNKGEVKIVHLIFAIVVVASLFISSIPILIHRTQCEEIIRSPIYKSIKGADQCFTFMENSGKMLAVQYFIAPFAILLFTSISLFLNLFIMNFAVNKDNKNFRLIRIISVLLIFTYPLYVLLRIPYFLNNT